MIALLTQRQSGAIFLAPPADPRVPAQGLASRFDVRAIGPCASGDGGIVVDGCVQPPRALPFFGLGQKGSD
ncbi:MAG TPA: hypothetical protein VFA43_17555 [Gemmatimonadaceae bacterium]|nr:hypothetical protein [Gemmatimonadaceae bacterium]